jgi:hypothetical protein
MFLTYLMLAVALSLSAIAAFYSIIGLTAIFAAAVIPVAVMGTILEIAKLTVTVWLHEYWAQCKRAMKVYLVPAVGVLMLITSMGIFGFLSKAHLDQAVPAGDISAQVAVYDEKIKTQRDNIEAARNALKQMDAQVDQVLGRSTDEKGAERAVTIRRQQATERNRLQQDISRAQTEIVKLNEQRAPIAAQARKVEAEVGPIKYIAALIYGDNPDQNLLEKAVRWVIIILVIVFDPLAIFMLLAATESYKWEKHGRREEPHIQETPPPDSPMMDTIATWRDRIKNWRKPNGTNADDGQPVAQDLARQPDRDDADVQPTTPVVAIPPAQWGGQDLTQKIVENNRSGEPVYVNMPDIVTARPDVQYVGDADEEEAQEEKDPVKKAKRQWKADNPDDTLHRHERLLAQGKIERLPWEQSLQLQTDDQEQYANVDFGTRFPLTPGRGDAFISVDFLPTKLFKWNGVKWIEVDKEITDSFTYNDEYIEYLIAKIGSGEYDADLLNENERQQIEARLRDDPKFNGPA